jgi:hypothetical protein
MVYILPPFYGIQSRDSEAKREQNLKLKVYYIGVDVFCYGDTALQSDYGDPINPVSSQSLAFYQKINSSDHDRGDI